MEMGDSNLYSALEGYDKSVRERKFRIAETEDRIESLKNSLKNVVKENEELKLRRDKLKMDTEVANAKYQAESKQRAILQDEKSALDASYAALMKQVEKKKKTIEAMKEFQQSRVNLVESVRTNYEERYRSIRSVNQLMSLNEEARKKSEEIAAKMKQIQEIKSKIEKMTENSKGNWNKFVKACLELAEVNSKISAKNEEDVRNKSQTETQPAISDIPKKSQDQTPCNDQTPKEQKTEETLEERLRHLTNGGTKSSYRSSGFQETLERLRETRMKLSSLSTSNIQTSGAIASSTRSTFTVPIVSKSSVRTPVAASVSKTSSIVSPSALTVPIGAAAESLSMLTARSPIAESLSMLSARSPIAVSLSKTTSIVSTSAPVASLLTPMPKMTAPTVPNVESLSMSTARTPIAASLSKTSSIVPTSAPVTSLPTPMPMPMMTAPASAPNDMDCSEVFKIPTRPVAPIKTTSSMTQARCVVTENSTDNMSTTPASPQLPSFLSFGEEFTSDSNNGFLNMFGDSETNSSGDNVVLSTSGYGFDNILFGSNASEGEQRSFF